MSEVVPPILFKYLVPDRIDVLTRGQIRISQRQVVNDDRDFRPEYLNAAQPETLSRFIAAEVTKDSTVPALFRPALVRFLVENFGREMLDITLQHLRTPDKLGMLCLTDNWRNDRMWHDYAMNSTGFVIAFNVAELAGTFLARLIVRRVRYTDLPIKYLLDNAVDLSAFYQKRTRWADESEWRGLGFLEKFPNKGVDPNGFPIHVCRFSPKAIYSIMIRNTCSIEAKLRLLLANDSRYRHVRLITI